MTEKRFRVTISNTNEVAFVDVVENKQLMKIIFKEESDAVDCKNALMYQCNLLNTFNDENEQLKKDVEYWKQVASQYSNQLNVFEHSKKYKTECKDIHWSSD